MSEPSKKKFITYNNNNINFNNSKINDIKTLSNENKDTYNDIKKLLMQTEQILLALNNDQKEFPKNLKEIIKKFIDDLNKLDDGNVTKYISDYFELANNFYTNYNNPIKDFIEYTNQIIEKKVIELTSMLEYKDSLINNYGNKVSGLFNQVDNFINIFKKKNDDINNLMTKYMAKGKDIYNKYKLIFISDIIEKFNNKVQIINEELIYLNNNSNIKLIEKFLSVKDSIDKLSEYDLNNYINTKNSNNVKKIINNYSISKLNNRKKLENTYNGKVNDIIKKLQDEINEKLEILGQWENLKRKELESVITNVLNSSNLNVGKNAFLNNSQSIQPTTSNKPIAPNNYRSYNKNLGLAKLFGNYKSNINKYGANPTGVKNFINKVKSLNNPDYKLNSERENNNKNKMARSKLSLLTNMEKKVTKLNSTNPDKIKMLSNINEAKKLIIPKNINGKNIY